MGKAFFFYQIHCPKKSCFCARSGGSFYLGFVMLFWVLVLILSPLKNFNETWNQSILETNERIKRKVRCWMTKASTFSWGSVWDDLYMKSSIKQQCYALRKCCNVHFISCVLYRFRVIFTLISGPILPLYYYIYSSHSSSQRISLWKRMDH